MRAFLHQGWSPYHDLSRDTKSSQSPSENDRQPTRRPMLARGAYPTPTAGRSNLVWRRQATDRAGLVETGVGDHSAFGENFSGFLPFPVAELPLPVMTGVAIVLSSLLDSLR